MLVNPDIQAWFDKLQGHPARGGSAPRGQGLPSAPLEGIVQPGRGMFGFNAPSIAAKFQPHSPAPYPGQQPMRGIPPVAPSSSGGGGRDLGGGAIAVGLGKLGAGIQQGLGDWAENRKAQADAQAIRDTAAASASRGFLAPKAPRTPTASEPEAPPTPAFPPVAAASETPTFAQPGGGGGAMGSSIGPASTSLPTLAQGAPAAAADNGPGFVKQFLAGIKAGEGVPYSGHSPTGAIGAYGLTGDFIKRYAPGAGLPTDRASYERDPALQDQLAKYAANKMYTDGMYPGGNFPNATGSWERVANGWLAGNPHGASQPGNMSSQGYINKVMNAANAAQPTPAATTQSAAAYAATPPTSAQPATASSQPVTPGQTDPHKPGFDPASVPFHRTPEMDQPPLLNGGQPGVYSAPQIGPQGMNDQANPLAAALAQGGQQGPQLDQSALLALALAQNQPDFSTPDLGGFFG
jgi:hypothetical protein